MNSAQKSNHNNLKPISMDEYTRRWVCKDGRAVTLRPISPEDKPLEKVFIEGLSRESSRFRFFSEVKEVTPEMLSQFCDIDYEHVIAIMAEYDADDERNNVGVGRLIIDPDMENGEFAIVVADAFQNTGLGETLLNTIIDIGIKKKLKSIYGIVMRNNYRMLNLAKKLGFTIEASPYDEIKVIRYL